MGPGQVLRNELDPNYVNVPAELVPEYYQGKRIKHVEFKLTASFFSIELTVDFTLKPGGLATDGEASYTGMDGACTSYPDHLTGTWSGAATGGDTKRLESLRITATDENASPFSLIIEDAGLYRKEILGDRTIIYGRATSGNCLIGGPGVVELDSMDAEFELVYCTESPETDNPLENE